MIRKNHIDQKIDFAISFNIITWKILRIMNFLGKIRILLTMVFPFFSWLFQSGKQVKIIKIHLVCHNGIFSLLSGIFTKYICCIFALQSLHSISKFLMTKTMCTVILLCVTVRDLGLESLALQTMKFKQEKKGWFTTYLGLADFSSLLHKSIRSMNFCGKAEKSTSSPCWTFKLGKWNNVMQINADWFKTILKMLSFCQKVLDNLLEFVVGKGSQRNIL